MSITRNDDDAPRVLLVDIDDPGAALRVYLDAADDHAHDAITVALAEALAAWTANAKRAP